MAVFFFDTSAIVKRYVNEPGSVWVSALVDPAMNNLVHLAAVTGVEVVSALTRRQRGGGLAQAPAARLLGQFRHDFAADYLLVQVTPVLIGSAMSPAESHGLRAYDAIQMAAALEVHAATLRAGPPLTLVSADVALNTAAGAEGLTVEDPNSHP